MSRLCSSHKRLLANRTSHMIGPSGLNTKHPTLNTLHPSHAHVTVGLPTKSENPPVREFHNVSSYRSKRQLWTF